MKKIIGLIVTLSLLISLTVTPFAGGDDDLPMMVKPVIEEVIEIK